MQSPPEVDPIEGAMQDLRKVVKAVEAYSRAVEARFGVTGPQLWATWVLGKGEPLSLKELAAQMHLSPSTLVGVVDRLAAKGLVSRAQDPVDRRRIRLTLTEAGRALCAQAPDPAQGRMVQGLQGLDPADLVGLRRGLAHLVNALEADRFEARFFFADG